ncbi:MAG TPA: DNA-processing protein DprA, partial [Thermoanaerobaculia bacterium]|nr:DNA-processing protein DprA [Thermoanaerobaculia bacterium]
MSKRRCKGKAQDREARFEPAYRDLLIALNLRRDLPNGSAYRLASCLEEWVDCRARGAPNLALAERCGVSREALERALELRGLAPELAEREGERAAGFGARILTLADADYPPPLKELSLPPPVLYLRGELPAGPALTVVGSRRADLYGLEVTRLFARELARAGVTIVSGFATGIDAAAHQSALTVPEGRTVAVLGCGLGVDYPSGHRRLAAELAERGALLSEYPPGTPPARWQFPVRNRILAALSQATLVARATARSGSLGTARLALDLGRDLWAIPGRLFEPGSEGPNGLIRAGAHVALHPGDLLESLGLTQEPPVARGPRAEPAASRSPAERLLALFLPTQPLYPEEIAEKTGLSSAETAALLLELELGGELRRLPG